MTTHIICSYSNWQPGKDNTNGQRIYNFDILIIERYCWRIWPPDFFRLNLSTVWSFRGLQSKIQQNQNPNGQIQATKSHKVTVPVQQTKKTKVIRTGNWSSDRKAGRKLWTACKSSTLCDGDGEDGPSSADSIMWRFSLEDIMVAHCKAALGSSRRNGKKDNKGFGSWRARENAVRFHRRWTVW